MAYKEVLGLVPTMQSAALASEAYGLVHKKKKKNFVKSSVNIISGTAMTKATAEIIGGF